MRQLISTKTPNPRRILPRRYCCEEMKEQLKRSCNEHDHIDCPDNVMVYMGRGNFGLLIHDGGTSVYTIEFCPWCGDDLTNTTKW